MPFGFFLDVPGETWQGMLDTWRDSVVPNSYCSPNTVLGAPDNTSVSTHNVLPGDLRDKACWSLNIAPSVLGNTWQSVLSVPVCVLDNILD